MRLRVIVPTLPPNPSGVGDYALILARHLREHAGMETEFFVGDPSWRTKGSTRLEGFPVEAFAARTPAAVEEALADGDGPVFLNYVGYGYQKRGVPFWLLGAMKRLRARRLPIITFFHELEASGPITSSAFWLNPAMRYIWVRLARLSQASFCTTSLVERMLLQHAGATARRFAIFSTIGEDGELVPFDQRVRRAVIFGKPTFRLASYNEHRADFERALAATGCTEIVDIGPPLPAMPAEVAGVPVRAMGVLEAPAIRAIMRESLLGFVPYPLPFACKSTIFAAYCAHGMLPMVHEQPTREVDGIVMGANVLPATPGMAPLTMDRMAEVAAAAKAWYDTHSIARTCDGITEALRAMKA